MILKNIKRICIIGFGSIGRKHFSIVREMYPEIEIILVRSGKGKNFGEEKFAKKIVNNIDEAINFSPEAAFICTPATLHLIQATKLIEKNIPILIEKPLSDSSIGIKDLKILANQSNAVILVGYVLRYSESLKFFKKMIDNKLRFNFDRADINCQSFLPDWRPNQDYKKSPSANKKLGGGVLLELSHEIDYIQWIFKKISKVNYAVLKKVSNLDIDTEDYVSIAGKTSASVFSLNLNFFSLKSIRKIIINGKDFTLEGDLVKNKLKIFEKNKVRKKKIKIDKDYTYRKQHESLLNRNFLQSCSYKEGIGIMSIIDKIKGVNKI